MRRFCLAIATAAILAGAAHAGQLTATASQNPVGQLSNSTGLGSVSAAWPDPLQPIAEATTTRTGIVATALGASTQMPVHQGASGTARTDYALWDLGTGAALAPELAAGLTLAFHFHLTGLVSVPPSSISYGSLGYDATLYSQVISGAGDAVNAVYGPTAPFPSEGYVYTGNTALLGSIDLWFDLQHQGSVGGLWTMGLSVGASGAGDATAALQLASITVLAGELPGNGLGVRLETGEILPVSAVPEAPAWALMLAGAAWALLLARRRGLAG